ncbi:MULTISPECIES: hypothetical protein [unclassified Pseudomonas]|uniref:hypothetical protein n=1 Tax=unclassified Pseudomonas TaxID=196821 RepID=UPI000C88D329|nr:MULTISPECIES: hypothetical protein [unclassified Pseudomonas]PMZ89805.1 hypothetical protein C1X61_10165 [Pseudomonas sp. FW215-T2]PNA15766.1 hypothetical protein C1X62_03730 [Pseudomonas sp. FW215-R3]PNB37793.1 hypothetical protein C1X63_11430 [Pseudomonas sp. FW305-131]
MNNVGVAGCRPFKPWLAEVWLFFDQVFLRSLQAALSTFLFGMKMHGVGVDKPVDKSVTKLWKDSAEGRGCWLGAIAGLTRQS